MRRLVLGIMAIELVAIAVIILVAISLGVR